MLSYYSQCRLEKVSEPLNLITCRSCFSSNNLHHIYPVAAYKTGIVQRNFGPFLLTKLFQFINIFGLSWSSSPLQVTPQHHNWVKIRTLTWPFQNIHFLLFQTFFGQQWFPLRCISINTIVVQCFSESGHMNFQSLESFLQVFCCYPWVLFHFL